MKPLGNTNMRIKKWIEKKQVPLYLEKWEKKRFKLNCKIIDVPMQEWFEDKVKELNDKVENLKANY